MTSSSDPRTNGFGAAPTVDDHRVHAGPQRDPWSREDPRDPSLPHDRVPADDTSLDWREATAELVVNTRKWIRANPAPAIGVAVAVGFLVGRVFRR